MTDAQLLFSHFLDAAARFGLTVSLKKSGVTLQPSSRLTYTLPIIMAGDTALFIAEKFCYLGSILSSDANIDNDISAHIARASQSFGRLSRRLWDNHGIQLKLQ